MTQRQRMIGAGVAAAALVLLAVIGGLPLVRGVHIGFVAAGAVPVGAVLLLAIARLTGADWAPLEPLAATMPVLVPLGVVAMLAGWGVALPDHLAVWQHPLATALRAGLASAALAFAGWRLAAGASQGFAGVTLAIYAALVTPVGSDWLLGTDPGHAVSAIGMMLFVQQVGSACAMVLVAGRGGERFRGDMAKLMIAASLGLCYLGFMDYLIVWFGNLPEHVRFYVERATPGQTLLVAVAILAALAVPIAALSLMAGEGGRRVAGAAALAGYWLFDLWWIGATWASALVAVVATVLMAAVLALSPAVVARRVAHG